MAMITIYDKAKKNVPVEVVHYCCSHQRSDADRARSILEEGRNNTGGNGGNVWVASVRLERDILTHLQTILEVLARMEMKQKILFQCAKRTECPDTPELYRSCRYEPRFSCKSQDLRWAQPHSMSLVGSTMDVIYTTRAKIW